MWKELVGDDFGVRHALFQNARLFEYVLGDLRAALARPAVLAQRRQNRFDSRQEKIGSDRRHRWLEAIGNLFRSALQRPLTCLGERPDHSSNQVGVLRRRLRTT